MFDKTFGAFVDKKQREANKQLATIRKMLEAGGFRVDSYLEDRQKYGPYIYCYNPTKSGSFEGIRIYKFGDELAFRIQNEAATHPYGTAYALPIEEMFHDFMTDEGVEPDKAAKMVMKAVVKEIRNFFERSVEAEREDRSKVEDGDDALMRSVGPDSSSMLFK